MRPGHRGSANTMGDVYLALSLPQRDRHLGSCVGRHRSSRLARVRMISIVLIAACVATLLGGCNRATNASPRSPTAGPTTLEQACDAESWPRAVPNVKGQLMDQAFDGSLFCFNFAKAAAPDGHDVLQDIVSRAPNYRVTSVSPPAGTLVRRATPVTVRVVPINSSEPPVFRPCDGVTTDEAARFMGTKSVTASPLGDQAGSVDQICDYSSPAHLVISELLLAGSLPIDPRTTFDTLIASGRGSDVSGLPARGYCTNRDYVPSLVVLLSGDRLYRATGENCDVLKQSAQVAIPRIGTSSTRLPARLKKQLQH